MKVKNAGNFSEWLGVFLHSQTNNCSIKVDCGTCVGCCTSHYFIHIRPQDTDAIAHIPNELLFPAPGLKGHYVLGFDENGKCPMLVDKKCLIYEYRPLTCRQYDCRVFAATGLNLDGENKPLINNQIKKWKFNLPNEQDHIDFDAVHKSAVFLKENFDLFPEDFIPRNTTQLAVLAIKVYEVFIKKPGETGQFSKNEIIKKIMGLL